MNEPQDGSSLGGWPTRRHIIGCGATALTGFVGCLDGATNESEEETGPPSVAFDLANTESEADVSLLSKQNADGLAIVSEDTVEETLTDQGETATITEDGAYDLVGYRGTLEVGDPIDNATATETVESFEL